MKYVENIDRFKTDMGDKYKYHIFSEEEIQEISRGFFEQNRELRIGYEEKKQMTQKKDVTTLTCQKQ